MFSQKVLQSKTSIVSMGSIQAKCKPSWRGKIKKACRKQLEYFYAAISTVTRLKKTFID